MRASEQPGDGVARRKRYGSSRTARLVGGVLMALVTLEVACLLALFALHKVRGIAYEPFPRLGLSGAQRDAIVKMVEGRSEYYTHHAEYGWSIKPGGAFEDYRANRQGLRADREYDPLPPEGVVRIACFGDSFTHGDEVSNSNKWTAVLERSAPNLEVLNFGVGGYGVDQAYLRFTHEGPAYRPHVVMIGFMTDNIERHVNVYRPFVRAHTLMPMTKPRFHVKDGALRLQRNPLPKQAQYLDLLKNPRRIVEDLREHDYHARHAYHESDWDVLAKVRLLKLSVSSLLKGRAITRNGVFIRGTEPYIVTLHLIEQFAADVKKAGATPVVVLFPGAEDLRAARRGRPLPYAPLREDLEQRGHLVLDTHDGFREVADRHRVKSLCRGHYSALGNHVVADYMHRWLVARGLLPGDAPRPE